MPPQLRIAEQTRDLKALQQGQEVLLDWGYPSFTTAGGALPDVESVEVWRATVPVAQEPQGTGKRDRQIKVQLLEAQGDRLVSLDAAGLEAATRGPQLHFVDGLESWQEEHRDETELVIWYAVRTWCCGGRASRFSNLARIVPQAPPEPPQWLSAEGHREGVGLAWTQDEELTTLVERSADGEIWETLNPNGSSDPEWRDESAAQGRSWSYRLRSVRAIEGGGRVVGEAGPTKTVDHPDVYPPAAPVNLVCLPEGERVRLRWGAGGKGLFYRISRSLGRGPARVIEHKHDGVDFEDQNPPFGRLTYEVRAVDEAGNQSEAATCETVIGATP